MTTTAKKVCIFLADALYRHGVRRVVVSPGSRNTPLIIAFNRHPGLEVYSVVDERSAAFIGLGMAKATSRPVAVCCTSGTATLNLGPAVAEAFYSSLPLIAVTADRPAEMVERRAPQTIRQHDLYSGFVKASADIACEDGSESFMHEASAEMDSIISEAVSGVPGPVQINVQLSAPLGQLAECEKYSLDDIEISSELKLLHEKSGYAGRTFIFVGTGACVSNRLLKEAAEMPGSAVFAECYTDLNRLSEKIITNVDPTLSACSQCGEAMFPDRVIKIGNSLLSKKYYDLFDSNAVTVNNDTELAPLLPYGYNGGAGFKPFWLARSVDAGRMAEMAAVDSPWSQFVATEILRTYCAGCNVQISNGMSIRYAQIFDWGRSVSVGCNRGVSGIDGSVSTAIGYAAASDCRTVLITGDMSFQYDIGALATNFIPEGFTIVVMNNRGGGIFRYIDTTRHLDELEPMISGPVNLPVEGLAAAFGFRYFKAGSAEQLREALNEAGKSKTIIEVMTDSETDNKVLHNYYKSI